MLQSLTPAFRATLSSQVLARLSAVDATDFSPIIRVAEAKMQKFSMPPLLTDKEAALALKQFYALFAQNPGQHAVSSTVDEYWHYHILNTPGYRAFCDAAFGCFMDHVPLDKSIVDDVAEVKVLYEKTHAALTLMFGDNLVLKAFPPEATDEVTVCRCDGRVELLTTCETRAATAH